VKVGTPLLYNVNNNEMEQRIIANKFLPLKINLSRLIEYLLYDPLMKKVINENKKEKLKNKKCPLLR
jgi:hypothetical protein